MAKSLGLHGQVQPMLYCFLFTIFYSVNDCAEALQFWVTFVYLKEQPFSALSLLKEFVLSALPNWADIEFMEIEGQGTEAIINSGSRI